MNTERHTPAPIVAEHGARLANPGERNASKESHGCGANSNIAKHVELVLAEAAVLILTLIAILAASR